MDWIPRKARRFASPSALALRRRPYASLAALAAALSLGPALGAAAEQAPDLTGVWKGDDGGKYHVRQVDNRVFWYMDKHPEVINVFYGSIMGNSMSGEWADLPGGRLQNTGRLALRIESGQRLVKTWSSAPYEGSLWSRPHPGSSSPDAAGPGGGEGPARNLSLRKPASQSSTSQWSNRDDAQGAVDGIKNGGFGFHTSLEEGPWWQVDLQTRATLDRLLLYNRLELQERTRSLVVLLSSDGQAWGKAYAHDGRPFGGKDGNPLSVDLRGASARYLRVQLREKEYLHLDEVEVYGWPAGSGGHASGPAQSEVEELIVPSTKPEKALSRPLEAGREYELEVSGTWDAWGNTPHGIDAVWCFAEWRCGKQGESWDQLRVDGKTLAEINGARIPYDPAHVYRVTLKGQGKPVELHIADALGSSGDNAGALMVRLRPR